MEQNTTINSKKEWRIIKGDLITKWAADIDPSCPLPEYPRPQLVRKEWKNLNGLWNYRITSNKMNFEEFNNQKSFDGEILVPYPVESSLSGVKKALLPTDYLWYHKTFKLNSKWTDKRILIHFGAIDWKSTIWINKKLIGTHLGGDVAFTYDITEAIYRDFEQENEIIIQVWDPSDDGNQERGKQKLNPSGIFYNALSGIWQTVWIEPVPKTYIENIRLIPDIDNSEISVKINTNNSTDKFQGKITIIDGEVVIIEKSILINKPDKINIPNPKLWSPDSPFLYDIKVELIQGNEIIDSIDSYFGMRKSSLGKDKNGNLKIMLNNEPIFQYGPLDQGWWPDGLYTAPTDEALKWDIEITKKMGFNMIRKHVKTEPARWYHHCDRLGMLVWQDMPSGGNYGSTSGVISMILFKLTGKFMMNGRNKDDNIAVFYNELRDMITQFYNSPSIVVWVPFNESWGQFQTTEVTDFIRKYDTSRLIDSASGWFDRGTGDIHSIHRYPGPKIAKLEEKRAIALSEFGGLGLPTKNHLWNPDMKNWGYKNYENTEVLIENYEKLMIELKKLIPKGLSGAVYTQTTDVEGEVNGLITYDREIIKIPVDKLKSLHNILMKDEMGV